MGTRRHGRRAVIAPSYGDIFFNNWRQNGLLPIRLPIEEVSGWPRKTRASPGNATSRSTFRNCQSDVADRSHHPSRSTRRHQHALLNRLDDIAQTMTTKSEIEAWQAPTRRRSLGMAMIADATSYSPRC